MPIDDDMKNMLREVTELSQTYRSEIADLGGFASEIASLGSFTPEFGVAALGHATSVAVATTFPCNTFESEVNHCPAAQQWTVCTP